MKHNTVSSSCTQINMILIYTQRLEIYRKSRNCCFQHPINCFSPFFQEGEKQYILARKTSVTTITATLLLIMPIKRVHCLCSSTHSDFVHFLLNFLQAAVQVMSLCVVTLMSLQAVVPQWTNTGGTSLTLWHKYIRSLRKKEDQNDLNET